MIVRRKHRESEQRNLSTPPNLETRTSELVLESDLTSELRNPYVNDGQAIPTPFLQSALALAEITVVVI